MWCTDSVPSLWHLAMEKCATWMEEGGTPDNWDAPSVYWPGKRVPTLRCLWGHRGWQVLGAEDVEAASESWAAKELYPQGQEPAALGYPATGCRVGMVMCTLHHWLGSPSLHPRGAWELQLEPCVLAFHFCHDSSPL